MLRPPPPALFLLLPLVGAGCTDPPMTSGDDDNDATADDDVTADDDTADDDTPPPDDDTSPPLLLCPSSGSGVPEELALWTANGNDLGAVRQDGSELLLHTFFSEGKWEDGEIGVTSGVSSVVAAGEYIAAVATRYVSGEEDPEVQFGVELVLFDRSGKRLWLWQQRGILSGALYMNEQGFVTYDRGYQEFDAQNPHLPGVIIDPLGTVLELPGVWPLADADVYGRIPACSEEKCGWVEEWGAGEWDDLLYPAATWPRMAEGGFFLLYLSTEGEEAALVAEYAGMARVMPLSGVPAGEVSSLKVVASDPQGWALVEGPSPGQWWRANLLEGTMDAFTAPWPEGLLPFEDADYCEAPPPTVDDQGNLVIPLQDGTLASPWRTDPVGSTWEPLGQPLTGLLQVETQDVGGTYVVVGVSGNNTFCPSRSWGEVPMEVTALAGDSLQILRPDEEVAWTLSSYGVALNWPVMLSEEGHCAVYFAKREEEDPEVTVLDVSSGTEFVVPATGGIGGWLLQTF